MIGLIFHRLGKGFNIVRVIIIDPKGFGDKTDGLGEAVLDITLCENFLYPNFFKYFRLTGLCTFNMTIFVSD